MRENILKGSISRNVGINLLCAVFLLALVFSFPIRALADTPGTITGDTVNVRSEANTTSTIITALKANDTVTILEETKAADGATWYKIKTSAGATGFVRSDFVKKSETTEQKSNETPTTNVTAVTEKTAYAAGNGAVNIRKNASAASELVATAATNSEVTITGEATGADGFKWYQIKFSANNKELTGFIRSDLVTFTKPANGEKPAETTVEGTTSEEEDSEVVEEIEEEVVEETETVADATAFQFLDPVGTPANLPASFVPVKITMNGNNYSAWSKGDFYVVYGAAGGSNIQWYIYDYKNNTYVAYEGLFDAVKEESETTTNLFLPFVIVCGAATVLLIITIVLAVKLAKYENDDDDYEDYDDGEDEDEDDDDDYEELDDDDFEEL